MYTEIVQVQTPKQIKYETEYEAIPFCYLNPQGWIGDSISGKDHHPSHQNTTVNLGCIGFEIEYC